MTDLNVASTETTHGNSAATLINQELQIEQGTASPGEPGEDGIPSALLLVCVTVSE